MIETDERQAQETAKTTRLIAEMFDRIAPTYDLLNALLSAGQHLRWARRMMRIASPATGERWLDIATGSGPLIAEALKREPDTFWIGIDPSCELLWLARKRKRLGHIPLILGAGENLPLQPGSIHGATIAYGLRNFADPAGGLREMARVLVPGGKLHILEFHPLEKPGRWGRGRFVQWYLDKALPSIGRVVSGDASAYRYLAESAGNFWTLEQLNCKLEETGFDLVRQESWMGRSVTLSVARRRS